MGSEQVREMLELESELACALPTNMRVIDLDMVEKLVTTAREQALREALQGLRMLGLANGETASADWHNGVQAAIGEVSRLSLMERKA